MLLNLTTHEMDVHTTNGMVHLEPSGQVARCDLRYEVVVSAEGVEISVPRVENVRGLPEPQEGVLLFVCQMHITFPHGKIKVL